MKKFSLLVMLLMCMTAVAEQQTIQVTVSNNGTLDKVDEPVTIRLSDLRKLRFIVGEACIQSDSLSVASQLDDMNGDGRADELFFLANVKAHESKSYTIQLATAGTGLQTAYTPARIYTALKMNASGGHRPDITRLEVAGKTDVYNDVHMHGVVIESELVGYRIYFDKRQNVDLYGKIQRRIELPKTEFHPTAQQLADGYGVDVLWAGQSIGCGTFKNYRNGAPANWDDVGTRGQQIVTSGPLRTVVEVYALHIPLADNQQYDLHQYYSLYAGHRDVRVDIRWSQPTGLQYCTGVQKVGANASEETRMGHKQQGLVRKDGIAVSWGCDFPDMNRTDEWPPEAVGLAVYLPTQYIVDSHESDLNYFYIAEPRHQELHYWLCFCADKEAEGYHSFDDWSASLDAWKAQCDTPLSIKIK